MSTVKKSYLDQLPPEILHKIYDELHTETILFSIRYVCRRLYKITNAYNRHRLDFRYVSRSDLHVMARLIDPKNVISLTLSDCLETDGQIRLFLSCFHLDQFIRLRSLTLTLKNDEDLGKFQDYIMKCCLTTVSISFDDYYSDNISKFLSYVLSINDLRKLELLIGDAIFKTLQWPIQNRLENLTLAGETTCKHIYFILNHSPNLRRLVLKNFYTYKSNGNIVTQSDMKQFHHLTSFSLDATNSLTVSDVELILTMFPSLTHLRLFAWTSENDYSLFDGCRWENLIQTKLPLLNQFEFCFSRRTPSNQDFTVMDSLIASFRTPFWLENKHWIVKYDYECDKQYLDRPIYRVPTSGDNTNYSHRSRLYTVPIIRDDFGYSSRETRIFQYSLDSNYEENVTLNSVLNIIDYSEPLILDSNKLILNINQLIKENIQEKAGLTMKYEFRNVTELTLLIDKEWSIDLIKHLSKTVNLSNLETICLDFQGECSFATTWEIEMNALFKRTCSLRSIRIKCNRSERMMIITSNDIGLKLPHYIKKLDIEIEHLENAQVILKHGKHLSRITFRPRFNGEDFADHISSWLKKMKRDFQCKLDWGVLVGCDCCDSVKAVCIWLDKMYE